MSDFILLTFGVFGISTLIAQYPGPADVLARLRSYINLLNCNICIATWILIGFVFAGVPIVTCMAILGGVIALERLI